MNELGKVGRFLYGIALLISTIIMVVYLIWVIDLYIQEKDMTWTDVKNKCYVKWHNLKEKIKGVFNK